MKTLIIFDSVFGNTETIARTIGQGLENDVTVSSVKDVSISDVKSCDVLIVGSPTHGGRPTPLLASFLQKIPTGSLINVRVGAFDTRFAPFEHGIGLRILMSVVQFAAERIGKTLVKKGGLLLAEPVGFIVEDKEGPLEAGEIERAKAWGRSLRRKL